jgi:hypothetical protein
VVYYRGKQLTPTTNKGIKMKTKISSVTKRMYASYKVIIVTDDTNTEYFLNFPLCATLSDIKKTWSAESCWKVI